METTQSSPSIFKLKRSLLTYGIILLCILYISARWASSVYQAWFAPSCTEVITTGKTLVAELAQQAPDSISKWASGKYDLSEDLILSVTEQEYTYTTWQAESISYAVYFVQGKFQKVYISWYSPNLTAKKVLECFGAPSHYTAVTIEQESSWQFAYDFWYPQSGVVAHYGATMNKNDPRPTKIEMDSSVELIFTVPTTIEEMANLFDFKFVEAQGIRQESLFVPWPGSVEGVKIIQLTENK